MIDEIVEEIEIEASPETVFEAWTTPTQLLEWWGDGELCRGDHWHCDLRPGGKWRAEMVGKDGKKNCNVEGEYLRVEPPKFLSFTWRLDRDEDGTVTTVEVEFRATSKGTLLKLKHYGFVSQAIRDEHEKGWATVVGWLRSYVEKKAMQAV
jgi:uncharacterized protein YndB with AHSA1/START domain